MRTEQIEYQDENQSCQGYLAMPESDQARLPVVLIVHDWSGRNEFACQKAESIAQLGYIGFALDVYGDGKVGTTLEEKQALIGPFIEDRQFLLKRLEAGLKALEQIPNADLNRVAIIGFCFGGLCALDLARSGANLVGAVSFHGLLNKPDWSRREKIDAKILVLHGYDDPMVSPEAVQEFCQEMTQANADWQVHMYGLTKHAFSNPAANDDKLGTVYNPIAEKRSWQSMENFLKDIFH